MIVSCIFHKYIIHIVLINNIHSPFSQLLPALTSTLYPSNFMSSLFPLPTTFSHKKKKVQLCWLTTLGGWLTNQLSLYWRKLTFPAITAVETKSRHCSNQINSNQMPSSFGKSRISCHSPLFRAEILSALSLCMLVYANGTMSVSSCVYLSCCVWKTLFPWSYPPPLALTIFLSSLPHRSLSL